VTKQRRPPNLTLRRIREVERQETREEFAEAIGKAARALGEKIDCNWRTVARWEDGETARPYPAYRRVLSALLNRPFSELGFTGPSRDERDNKSQVLDDSYQDQAGELPPIEAGQQLALNENSGIPFFDEYVAALSEIGNGNEDSMKRRALLKLIGGAAGTALARPFAGKLEAVRHEMNLSLAERHAATDADEWQEIALEYGENYLSTPPIELLDSLLVDLVGLRSAMRRYVNDEVMQRELRRVGALLAAFIAQTIANLGSVREARRWWRTARRAADESGDTYSALWIRGREIVRAGYEHRPLTVVLSLIEEADTFIDGAPPVVVPQLLAGKAQTLALMGGRRAEAEETLKRLHASFAALPTSFTSQSGSLFVWGAERLYFTQSFVYSHLGDFARADRAQSAALPLYSPSDIRQPAQLELHRALCLIRGGDIAEGTNHARTVIAGLPAVHRIRPIIDLGRDMLTAIPQPEQRRPVVQEYREWLDASFGSQTRQLTA
jgi:hypothetical protein